MWRGPGKWRKHRSVVCICVSGCLFAVKLSAQQTKELSDLAYQHVPPYSYFCCLVFFPSSSLLIHFPYALLLSSESSRPFSHHTAAFRYPQKSPFMYCTSKWLPAPLLLCRSLPSLSQTPFIASLPPPDPLFYLQHPFTISLLCLQHFLCSASLLPILDSDTGYVEQNNIGYTVQGSGV